METVVRVSRRRRRGWIGRIRVLLLRSVNRQRLLNLLILLPLLSLLLALDCPTPLYSLHLLTTLVTNRSRSLRPWSPFLNTFSILITTDKAALAANPLSLSVRRWIPTGPQHVGLVVRKVPS